MPVIFYFNDKYERLIPEQDWHSLTGGKRVLNFNYEISKKEFIPFDLPKLIDKNKIKASDYFNTSSKNDKWLSCVEEHNRQTIFNDLKITIQITKCSCVFDYENCLFFYYTLFFQDYEYYYEYLDQAVNSQIEKEFNQNLMYNFDERKHYFKPKLNKDIVRIDKLKSYHKSKYGKLHIPGFDISIINQNRYVQFKESEKQIVGNQVALSTNYKIKKIQ